MAAAKTRSVDPLKDRIIDPDDQAFIEQEVSGNYQEVYWKGWVTLYTKSRAAAKKERILVVTNFRIFTVKQGVLKRSTRQSFPILDLETMQTAETAPTEMHVVFGGQEIDIMSDSVVDIARAIMFAFKSITYGLPAERTPVVELPPRFTDGFFPPSPDMQDGILATYLAFCDYCGTAPKLPVLDYFMSSFETNERDFDLGDCLGPVDKATFNDILTIASALRYTNWFDEIVAVGYPLKDEGLAHLACVFATCPQIRKLVLVDGQIKRGGVGFLAESLALGKHGLNYLNLSHNNIGDAGVRTLLESLQTAPKVLSTLILQSCGFSNKGFRALVEVLRQPSWLTAIRVLDVSDNTAGKNGTQALCEWLQETSSLEQLYVMRCNIDCELLFPALNANEQISQQVMTTLNLSGNKVSKKCIPALCELLRSTSSLSHLYLNECSLPKTAVVEILTAAMANTNGVHFWIELAGNSLEKGGLDLGSLFAASNRIENIHTLVLSNNNMNAEALISIVQGLKGKGVHTLALDSNVKTGMFASKTEEAGRAIAEFVRDTPRLEELSIAGDGSHYLGAAAYPIIEALRTNTTLKHIDVSRNRLGDEGLHILCEVITQGTCALRSFNAERNRITLKGLRELHTAVVSNTTLVDWAVPLADIENACKGAGAKIVEEVKAMVFDFEQVMERNSTEEVKTARLPSPGSSLMPPEAAPRRASGFRRRGKGHARGASDMFAHIAKQALAQEEAPPPEAVGGEAGEQEPAAGEGEA